jgi:hypothetical protein
MFNGRASFAEQERLMKHETFKTEAAPPLDLGKPSLEALAFRLRHRETWPPGFEWNYSSCLTCAFGLAQKMWRVTESGDTVAGEAGRWFNIPKTAAREVFVWAAHKRGCDMSAVTPEMVADDIDLYLASRS